MAKIQLESNRTFYLTLGSMIQSLALGYLLTNIDFTVVPSIAGALQILSTLTLIILVWHEYAISTMLFIWIVDLWDSVILFTFGFVEFYIISTLNTRKFQAAAWFFGLCAFAIVSLLAFINQYSKADMHKENDFAMSLLGSDRKKTLRFVAMSAFTFLIEGVVAHVCGRAGWAFLSATLAATGTCVSFAAREVRLYPRIMKKIANRYSSPPSPKQ